MISPEYLGAIRPARDVVSDTTEPARVVLLRLTASAFYTLTPAASRLWPLIAAGHTIPELITALAEGEDLSPDVARATVSELVAALDGRGLIECAGP